MDGNNTKKTRFWATIMDGDDTQKARLWATICHLSSLAWLPLTGLWFAGIPFILILPFTYILGPLAVWRLKRNQHPFIDAHAKECLNFQISILLYTLGLSLVYLFGGFLISLLPILESSEAERLNALLAVLGVALKPMSFIIPLTGIVDAALAIAAAFKARKGEYYRYPNILRFVK